MPLWSRTGSSIRFQLSGLRTARLSTAASQATRSRTEKYRDPSAVVFSIGATHVWFFTSPFSRRYPDARFGTMSASVITLVVVIPAA